MNIIEVVLENIPRVKVVSLLGKLTGISADESIFLELDTNQVYNCSLPRLECDSFLLNDTHVRIIKYDSKFDLEISFSLKKQAELSDIKLCDFFTTLAQDYQVGLAYAGLEPASDKETRIFTGTFLGPMSLTMLQ